MKDFGGGKWDVDLNLTVSGGEYFVVDDSGYPVAQIFESTDSMITARANLIARAPEMYLALHATKKLLEAKYPSKDFEEFKERLLTDYESLEVHLYETITRLLDEIDDES